MIHRDPDKSGRCLFKALPNGSNMLIQHHPTLLNPTCCTRLATMLDDVERSLISIKHHLQHRPTFLLFSAVNKYVAFVWPPCSTLLNAGMPTKLTLRVSVSMAMILFIFALRIATWVIRYGE